MYYIFWFFKQFYYILDKITKHKYKIIFLLMLLVIVFFIFHSKVFAYGDEVLTDGNTSANIVPTQDMFDCLSFSYNNAEVTILSALEKAYLTGNTTPLTDFVNFIDAGYFAFYDYYESGRIVTFLYKPTSANNKTTMAESTYGTYAFRNLQANFINRANNSMVWFGYVDGTFQTLNTSDNGNYNVPAYLYLNKTELLRQFVLKYKYPASTNSYDSVLQNIKNSIDIQTNSVNNQTNAINNQTNAIQEQTNSINNQTNVITDSTVEDSSVVLPTDSTNDITADGLNGIFTSMYNAFCTGQAKDIVFPIPFTNKNITLKSNYVRQMLSNSGATWVITIIEAFWWYIISRFIIKDITNKITKIKSGNIESIEETNIKGDML